MMKSIQYFLFTAVTYVILSTSTHFAAINKNKIVGTWQISATISEDVSCKNWVGTITIKRKKKMLTGVLDWSCSKDNWHVKEEFDVTLKANTVTLQGTAVELISHPENNSEYFLDNFKFTMDDISEQTVPVSLIDGRGKVATFIISKG